MTLTAIPLSLATINSPMLMVKPPSPKRAITWRSGYSSLALKAAGKPKPIDRQLPEIKIS